MLRSEHPNDMDLIKQVAIGMRSPEVVRSILVRPENRNPDPAYQQEVVWKSLSISGGYPSAVPLFAELDRLYPDERWDQVAHEYITEIRDVIEQEGIESIAMFGGLAGVCFVIRHASRQGSRYQNLLAKLDSHLHRELKKTYIEPLSSLFNNKHSVPNWYYEVIRGLAGIGSYVLKSPLLYSTELVGEILTLLIGLVFRSVCIDGKTIPGWHIPSESFFTEEEQIANPNGNFNLGLSHGIPGVLAFLSIALQRGFVESGQREAIETIVAWLKTKRSETNNRIYWPATISFEEEICGSQHSTHKSKDAWCYGTPGVSRSLYLAGEALQDAALKEYALESFCSIFNSEEKEWEIPCPTFCHGISGLLKITHLMARDSHLPYLQKQVIYLKALLLSHYCPQAPFGFKSLERQKNGGYAAIDKCDLLGGSVGILLTLLSLNAEGCSWHLPFLIDSKI